MENEINTKELLKAMTELAETKGIDKQIIIDAMSEALKKAYLKASGDDNDTIVRVDFDEKSGKIKMFKIKNVVETGMPFLVKNINIKGGKRCHQ